MDRNSRHFSTRVRSAAYVAAALMAVGAAGAVIRARADEPKVRNEQGHSMPLMVKLTYSGGETETSMLTSTEAFPASDEFRFRAVNFTGSSLMIWLDTISAIKEINDKDVLVISKSGSQKRLVPQTTLLYLVGRDGSTQTVEFKKLRSIEFVKPPRKDKLGNAMYTQWRYSPYTGERLALE